MLNEGCDLAIAVFASNFDWTIKHVEKVNGVYLMFDLLDIVNDFFSFLLNFILFLFSSIHTSDSVA